MLGTWGTSRGGVGGEFEQLFFFFQSSILPESNFVKVRYWYGSVPRATVTDGNRAAAWLQIREILYGRCLWIFAAKNPGKMCSTPIFGYSGIEKKSPCLFLLQKRYLLASK